MAGRTVRRKTGDLGPLMQGNSLGASYVEIDGRVERRSHAALEKKFF
jgi:hypothetical protein